MKHNEKNKVVIALGSNQDPESHLEAAKQAIKAYHHILKWSEFQQTKPVGAHIQKDFINGVVLIETDWDEPRLKAWLQSVEDQEGRDHSCESMVTLDLDIVVWNGVVVHSDVEQRDFLKRMIAEVL